MIYSNSYVCLCNRSLSAKPNSMFTACYYTIHVMYTDYYTVLPYIRLSYLLVDREYLLSTEDSKEELLKTTYN